MATIRLATSWVLLALAVHYVFTATTVQHTTTGQPTMTEQLTTTDPLTTTHHQNNHHHHNPRPTHSSEPSESAHLMFHYDQASIEKLLVAKQGNSCYAYPLIEHEVKAIHTPIELFKLESHLMYQIAQKAYTLWTYDDLAVRSGYYSRFCHAHFEVFRIERL